VKRWQKFVLFCTCLFVGIRRGVRYGWIAGRTHWKMETISENQDTLLDRLRRIGY